MAPDAAQLPTAVRDLAHRLGAKPGDPRIVCLTQSGRMRSDAAAAWMTFRARQTIATASCAFEWRARAGPGGMISVTDALTDGVGALQVRALGFIPLARLAATPALTRGELMRYLAELPLAPDGILSNAGLRWRSDGPDRLIVGAGEGETGVEVTLGLDGEGRVATAFAPDRPRAVKKTNVPTPWGGRFADYRLHDGLWLPFAADVSWTIDGAAFVYWEGRMETWERRAAKPPHAPAVPHSPTSGAPAARSPVARGHARSSPRDGRTRRRR